ncbi:MAG TPA: alpha-ketoglutarate-dependent dioxygenase AlkB [Lysobacter sp.]|nr:alpha-ketoglutarate-dependent dioxygenase AlkB [Lysobacter sp.]
MDRPPADPDLRYRPDWLDPAAAAGLFEALRAAVPWEQHRIRLFGREHAAPRLSCWIGDADAVYRYSGSRFLPRPWLPELAALRARLQAELAVPFNSVLANLYRDGKDAMGWHSDDEPELGPAPVIASVSLGAPRRFLLRHRRDPTRRRALLLEPGSLLVMAGASQRDWKHALPRTARPVGARINLTFRNVRPR